MRSRSLRRNVKLRIMRELLTPEEGTEEEDVLGEDETAEGRARELAMVAVH